MEKPIVLVIMDGVGKGDGGSGMWIGILIVGIVLLALLLGALVFRGTRPKGKFSA